MPVRLKDIAQHLDLSITTVSRALGGYSDVTGETRQRVDQATIEMGYYRDASAPKLQKQRTDTIGSIFPTSGPRSAAPFLSEVRAGLGNEASQHGMGLLVATHPQSQARSKPANGGSAAAAWMASSWCATEETMPAATSPILGCSSWPTEDLRWTLTTPTYVWTGCKQYVTFLKELEDLPRRHKGTKEF